MPLVIRGPNVIRAFERLPQELESQIPRALQRIGLLGESELKVTLSTPGRGRLRRSARTRVGRGGFKLDSETGKRSMKRRGVAKVNFDLTDRHSAPGDPPAPDKGDLRDSATHDFPSANGVRWGSGLEYAFPLEYGTTGRGGGRGGRGRLGSAGTGAIAPRPFVRPTAARIKPQVDQIVKDALRQANQAAGLTP